jgi:hypothetical protein
MRAFLSQEALSPLVLPFTMRLRLVAATESRSIPQCGQSLCPWLTPGDAVPHPEFRLFTKDEGAFIIAYISEPGSRWRKIPESVAQRFGDRHGVSINQALQKSGMRIMQQSRRGPSCLRSKVRRVWELRHRGRHGPVPSV